MGHPTAEAEDRHPFLCLWEAFSIPVLQIPKWKRQLETGKHLPLFVRVCGCSVPRASSAWPCQRLCGRKQRQPWAFLHISPLVAEFLRLLLLPQHPGRARDDEMVSLCCLLLAYSRHKPRFVCGVPVTVHSPVVCVRMCVSPSPSPCTGLGMLAKGTGLPSIPALL